MRVRVQAASLTVAAAMVVVGVFAAGGSSLAATSPYTLITVDSANSGFTPSGFDVEKGQEIGVQAEGTVTYCGDDPECTATPAGGSKYTCIRDFNAPDAQCAALIARIGDGRPFFVGPSASIKATADGPLEFGVQDFKFDDNSGSFTVRLHIPQGQIVGDVLDKRGSPVPGTTIEARGPGGETATTQTGIGGSYNLRLGKAGKYTVKAKSPDVRQIRPKQQTVTVKPNKSARANFTADSRCGDGGSGPPKPMSGVYSDNRVDLEAGISSLYYSCRTGKVAVVHRFRSCGGQPNEQYLTTTLTGTADPRAGGYSFDLGGTDFFQVHGEFPSRKSVSYTVTQDIGETAETCFQYARRFNFQWPGDLGKGQIEDLEDDFDAEFPVG